jgi:hypothetical protein
MDIIFIFSIALGVFIANILCVGVLRILDRFKEKREYRVWRESKEQRDFRRAMDEELKDV